jgi:hypothetical protein
VQDSPSSIAAASGSTAKHEKVLLAIPRFRTAALGRHRDQCSDCGHTPAHPDTNPIARGGFLEVAVSEAPIHCNSADASSLIGASDTALRLLVADPHILNLNYF